MIKIAIVGAAGRMGQALARCSKLMPQVQLVAAVEAASSPLCGKDIGLIAGVGENGVLISSDLAAAVKMADVLFP